MPQRRSCAPPPGRPEDGPVIPDSCPYASCRMDTLEYIEDIKRQWEAIADSLSQLVCLLDSHGRIVRVNRTLERWGLGQVATAPGRELHDLLHPGCHSPDCYLNDYWRRAGAAVLRGRQAAWQAEDPVLRRHVELQINVPPVEVGGNGRLFAVAVLTDVTGLRAAERELRLLTEELERRVERRTAELHHSNLLLLKEVEDRLRAEADLEVSREEYRILVETMNEGLAVQDDRGIITYVNERLARMLGYEREAIIGHPAVEFIDPSSRPSWSERAEARRAGNMSPYELVLRASDGHQVWTKVSPSPMFDRSGRLVASFAVVTDISDRVRAERELRLLSAQVLSAQEQERQRIAAELHDGLGQSLSAIKFNLENALSRMERDGGPAGPAEIEALIPRIQGAIEEVRRISMDLRPSILDDLGILATLRWFCREFQQDYQGIGVALCSDIREDEIPDALKLVIFRIVQEALNNVAKHAQTDTVSVHLARHGAGIVLEVADQGVGFDLNEASARRSRRKGGAGLASMRERADYSGGEFQITSGNRTGTHIRIAWPNGGES